MNFVAPSGRYDRAGGGAASAVPSNERTRLELAVLPIVRVGEGARARRPGDGWKSFQKFNG